jgi:hypothetical protein
MADDDRREEPSLELPSLFRRRNKADKPTEPAAPPRPAEPPAAAPVETPTQPVQVVEPEPAPVAAPAPQPAREPDPAPAPPAPARAARRAARTGPVLPITLAALVVGLVVGLAGAGLTWGGLQACEAVRGTESCGGSGLLLLVAIVAVMALVGAVLLALLRVPDARSVSVLGTGIVCVVAMVGLLEVVFSGAMFVAVPVVGALGYVVASWVTTRFVEQVDDRPDIDVR